MAANYNRPKPIDPIYYRAEWVLRITCRCGRKVEEPLGQFASAKRIDNRTRIYKLFERLKCSTCGGRPSAELVRGQW